MSGTIGQTNGATGQHMSITGTTQRVISGTSSTNPSTIATVPSGSSYGQFGSFYSGIPAGQASTTRTITETKSTTVVSGPGPTSITGTMTHAPHLIGSTTGQTISGTTPVIQRPSNSATVVTVNRPVATTTVVQPSHIVGTTTVVQPGHVVAASTTEHSGHVVGTSTTSTTIVQRPSNSGATRVITQPTVIAVPAHTTVTSVHPGHVAEIVETTVVHPSHLVARSTAVAQPGHVVAASTTEHLGHVVGTATTVLPPHVVGTTQTSTTVVQRPSNHGATTSVTVVQRASNRATSPSQVSTAANPIIQTTGTAIQTTQVVPGTTTVQSSGKLSPRGSNVVGDAGVRKVVGVTYVEQGKVVERPSNSGSIQTGSIQPRQVVTQAGSIAYGSQPLVTPLTQTVNPTVKSSQNVASTSGQREQSFSPSNIQISATAARHSAGVPPPRVEAQVSANQQQTLRRTDHQAVRQQQGAEIPLESGNSSAPASGIQFIPGTTGTGQNTEPTKHKIIIPLGADGKQISKEELTQIVRAEMRKSGHGGQTAQSGSAPAQYPVIVPPSQQPAVEPHPGSPAQNSNLQSPNSERKHKRPVNVSSLITEKRSREQSPARKEANSGPSPQSSADATRKGYKIGDGLVLGAGTRGRRSFDEKGNEIEVTDLPTLTFVENAIDEPMIYSHRPTNQANNAEVTAEYGSQSERKGFGNRGPSNREELLYSKGNFRQQGAGESYNIYARGRGNENLLTRHGFCQFGNVLFDGDSRRTKELDGC